jgi:hypothetical protein
MKNSVELGAYTRYSINKMTGDENDLLSESPLFERSNQSDTGRRVDRPPANLVDDAEEIDPALIKEIEIYI